MQCHLVPQRGCEPQGRSLTPVYQIDHTLPLRSLLFLFRKNHPILAKFSVKIIENPGFIRHTVAKYRRRTAELQVKKCASLKPKDSQPGDPLNIFSFQSIFYLVLYGLCAGIVCFFSEKAWHKWKALKPRLVGRRIDFGLVPRQEENTPPRSDTDQRLHMKFPGVCSAIPSEGQYPPTKNLPEIPELISSCTYISDILNNLQKLEEAEMQETLKRISEELALLLVLRR